jgi:parallel beta-helix repeat protein
LHRTHAPRSARETMARRQARRTTSVLSIAFVVAALVAMSGLAVAARADIVPRIACTGVAMTAGQADIDANDAGTTFCLSGTHAWSLVPKDGDTFIGGTLDGGGTIDHAFSGRASNVTISNVRVNGYDDPRNTGAIDGSGDGWTLQSVIVSGNAFEGVTVRGTDWQIRGGRFFNNGQIGIRGSGQTANGLTVDGVEVDHNGFADTTYSDRQVACYGAGGVKFEAENVTVQNSSVHDNGCRGILSDRGADTITLVNNRIDDNWDEGIVIDVAGSATIRGNEVSGNGLHDSQATSKALCGASYGSGAGILIDTSGQTHTVTGSIDVGFNTVAMNCNALTGVNRSRSLLNCSIDPICELRNVSVHDNTISASTVPGATNEAGWWADDGEDLSTHNLVWLNNHVSAGIDLTLTTTPPVLPPPVTGAAEFLIPDLMSKPMSGSGWSLLASSADKAAGAVVTLADQSSFAPSWTLAAALVAARTGSVLYRGYVVANVARICGTEKAASDELALSRTLFGYVTAASIIGLPLSTPCGLTTYGAWLKIIRDEVIGSNGNGDTLTHVAQWSANNWGAYALSSHLAVSYALNDSTAIASDIAITEQWLGDLSSPAATFRTDASYRYNGNGATWDLTPTMQRGINPQSSDQRSGALIEDALRLTSGGSDSQPCCTVSDAAAGYQSESLDGLISTMQLLLAHGVDIRHDQNNALLRAFRFYWAHGPSPWSVPRYEPYVMNDWYGTSFSTSAGDSVFRHLGWGAWLAAGA